jgi:hypothetical protein
MSLGVEEVLRSLTLHQNIANSGSAITQPCDQNVLCKYDVSRCTTVPDYEITRQKEDTKHTPCATACTSRHSATTSRRGEAKRTTMP